MDQNQAYALKRYCLGDPRLLPHFSQSERWLGTRRNVGNRNRLTQGGNHAFCDVFLTLAVAKFCLNRQTQEALVSCAQKRMTDYLGRKIIPEVLPVKSKNGRNHHQTTLETITALVDQMYREIQKSVPYVCPGNESHTDSEKRRRSVFAEEGTWRL